MKGTTGIGLNRETVAACYPDAAVNAWRMPLDTGTAPDLPAVEAGAVEAALRDAGVDDADPSAGHDVEGRAPVAVGEQRMHPPQPGRAGHARRASCRLGRAGHRDDAGLGRRYHRRRQQAYGWSPLMKMDRKLQREVLRQCREAYPQNAKLEELPVEDSPHLQANLIYLYELELITGILVNGNTELRAPQITAAGLDFLEDDGGVSAILRTVTVRLDPDDLRALMAARVEASDLPAEEKDRLSHAMRSLPTQTLRDLTTRLVNEAVDRLPDAVRLLQTYAGLS